MALAFLPSYSDSATASSWTQKATPAYALVSTFAASDGKSQLIRELNELMMDCVQDDWDGHGSAKASRESYEAALRFVRALPPGFQLPEPVVDRDGCFSFEWRRGPRRSVVVAVHPDYSVHWASWIGSARQHGTDAFFNELPTSVRDLVKQLYSV